MNINKDTKTITIQTWITTITFTYEAAPIYALYDHTPISFFFLLYISQCLVSQIPPPWTFSKMTHNNGAID